MPQIFLHYDRQALDREYNNHAKVQNFADYFAWYSKESFATRSAMSARYDVPYGEHPGEILDIFPAIGLALAPIHIHIHGGYWQRLSKEDYSFVARTLVPEGAVALIINYALIPTVGMDELVRQCRAAAAWAYRNANSFGGDASRIFVSGHSAGGHLVAMLMATDWASFAPDLPQGLVKGGVAMSGIYDLEPIRLSYLNDVLRLTREEARRNSPIHIVPPRPSPLVVSVGGLEGPEYHRQRDSFVEAWRRHGYSIDVIDMPGHHHFSMLKELGDVRSPISRAILAQMRL